MKLTIFAKNYNIVLKLYALLSLESKKGQVFELIRNKIFKYLTLLVFFRKGPRKTRSRFPDNTWYLWLA
jgi:hypothetical protein